MDPADLPEPPRNWSMVAFVVVLACCLTTLGLAVFALRSVLTP
jgi:hypothetical protein